MENKIDKLIIEYLEHLQTIEDKDEFALLNQQVAFNIPAIFLVSSPKLWKFIKEQYFKLLSSDDPKVKASLAASFHEIFKIQCECQPAKQYESDMISVFKNFIATNRDTLMNSSS